MNIFRNNFFPGAGMMILAVLFAFSVQGEEQPGGVAGLIPDKRVFNHPSFGGKLSDPFYVHEHYDPRKDLTGVVTHVRIVETETHELYMGFLFNYPGDIIETPKEVVVLFHSFSNNWRFREKTDAVLTTNGDTLNLGSFNRDPVDGPMGISEHLYKTIRLNAFLSIVNGRNVEGRVGDVSFTLTEEHLEAFRNFASRMKP